MKKTIYILISVPFLAITVAGCSSTKNDAPLYTDENYSFSTVYMDTSVATLKKYNPEIPEENGVVTYTLNKVINNDNYLKYEYETDVNVVGWINYFNFNNPSEKNSEKFFLEAGTNEYTTFLDAFRKGAYGNFRKVITTITFQNVDDTKEGTFSFRKLSVSDRTYDPQYSMFISDGTMKVGTTLNFGGCIKYIERLDADVVEYLEEDGSVKIDRDIDEQDVNVISENVNLVNIYDLGREIQQSFYWDVDESNGYVPSSPVKYDADLHYNPIQCGSAGSVNPQVIDYYYHEDEIYVKAYGQDWFLENSVDPTIFENRFSFAGDGVLLVENRITNFAQFTGLDDKTAIRQETPAFYCVQPLNYFYAETKQGTVMDPNLFYEGGSVNVKTSLTDNITEPYHYRIPKKNMKENWCAFVNENKFGLGIYTPGADYFNASRGAASTNYYTEAKNSRTNSDFYDGSSTDFAPSEYVYNYDYISTNINLSMTDFVPLSYSYALFAGDTEEMSEAFGQLEKENVIDNSNLSWPRR